MLGTAMGFGVDLAPLLVGPFAKPASPLALMVLGMEEEGRRARLRQSLLDLAVERLAHPRDPELALAVLDATGVSPKEVAIRVAALRALGRVQEAYGAGEPDDGLAADVAGGAAEALDRAIKAADGLRPLTACRLVSSILRDPPTLRVELDALTVAARAALMLGDEEEAFRHIDRLCAVPEFDREELLNYPELRRLLLKAR
jgi:hypothetical protein